MGFRQIIQTLNERVITDLRQVCFPDFLRTLGLKNKERETLIQLHIYVPQNKVKRPFTNSKQPQFCYISWLYIAHITV